MKIFYNKFCKGEKSTRLSPVAILLLKLLPLVDLFSFLQQL